MKRTTYLLLLILIIALNIFAYNSQNGIYLNIFQLMIELCSMFAFIFILLNLEKSPYSKVLQIMTLGIFVSLFRWWKEPFVITKFLANYAQDFYSQYGQYLIVFLILIVGGSMIKKLELFNKSNL